MATIETQKLLGEHATPTVITRADVDEAMKVLAPIIGKLAEQIGKYGRLAQLAELAETDAAVRAVLPELFQKYGALRRQLGELERHSRDLAATHRQMEEVEARVRAAAGL
jgi:arginine/lysine/ornithine decarboxylase